MKNDTTDVEGHVDKVKKIIDENPDVWETRGDFFKWLKGVFRKGWNNHPVKLKLLKKTSVDIPNPNPKSVARFPTVKGKVCAKCGNAFPRDQCEVDHVIEEPARLTSLEEISSCVEKLLVVSSEDLRVVCKECHKIISHSQRKGLSFEDARIDKQVIALMNDKKARDKLLKEHGCIVSNDVQRRNALTEILKNEGRSVSEE